MSLNISPGIEDIVRERAEKEGMSVDDLLERTFAAKDQEVQPQSDPGERVRALLRQWQAADNTPGVPPIPTLPGETPTMALFRTWEEEDANLTDAEIAEDERIYSEIEQNGIPRVEL